MIVAAAVAQQFTKGALQVRDIRQSEPGHGQFLETASIGDIHGLFRSEQSNRGTLGQCGREEQARGNNDRLDDVHHD